MKETVLPILLLARTLHQAQVFANKHRIRKGHWIYLDRLVQLKGRICTTQLILVGSDWNSNKYASDLLRLAMIRGFSIIKEEDYEHCTRQ